MKYEYVSWNQFKCENVTSTVNSIFYQLRFAELRTYIYSNVHCDKHIFEITLSYSYLYLSPVTNFACWHVSGLPISISIYRRTI